jgi:hypothetical protein
MFVVGVRPVERVYGSKYSRRERCSVPFAASRAGYALEMLRRGMRVVASGPAPVRATWAGQGSDGRRLLHTTLSLRRPLILRAS